MTGTVVRFSRHAPPRSHRIIASPGAILSVAVDHDHHHPPPQPMPRLVLCPYCGDESTRTDACGKCGGRFDPLSRQATINAMGPWMVRNPARPFHPGCSYEVICQMVASGKIRPDTVLRGPTTGQFWSTARRTPGVAGLLGICYACQKRVPTGPGQARPAHCPECGAATGHVPDRQHLGLGPVHLLPGRSQGLGSAHTPSQGDNPGTHTTPGSSPRRTALLIAIVVLAMVAAGGIAAWLLGPASSHQSRSAERTLQGDPSGTSPSGEPGSPLPSAASGDLPSGSTHSLSGHADASIQLDPPRSDADDSRAKQGNVGQIGNIGGSDSQSSGPLDAAHADSLIQGSRDSIGELLETQASDPQLSSEAMRDIARKRLEYLDFREWFKW